jgi:NAD-dependent SIR2 family protein deacetylase
MSPRTIASKTFLHHFCDRNGQSEKRFCFILGAGASRASGIPTGAELARQWIGELEERYPGEELEQWYAEAKIDKNDPAPGYSAIYD